MHEPQGPGRWLLAVQGIMGESCHTAAITNTEGVSLVSGEVYDAENTRDLCDRADTFFGMLPVMVGEAMK